MNFPFSVHSFLLFHDIIPFLHLSYFPVDKWFTNLKENKGIVEMFDSNGEPMFDDLEFFDTYDEKMPKVMNMKSIFYEIPYWEHLNISHLLDPMHIF